MVKAPLLGLLLAAAATMCGLACAAPVSHTTDVANLTRQPYDDDDVATTTTTPTQQEAPLDDPAARSERSTNLSHVTGAARKIQMFIKNRHLQLLPDGTVNGTTDDTSLYTILQRTTIGIGQMKIQGVATCQYLCMDSCGLLYGSREFVDECIFNETIEQHHYNTYSSTKYSNERRTLYLALNRRGQPRKVLLRARQQLGRLSSYTRVLTRTVAPERADDLHPLRHHGHSCPVTGGEAAGIRHDADAGQQRCRRRKKRKKKKRKCEPDEEDEDGNINNERCNVKKRIAATTKKCENEKSDECQRDVTMRKKTNVSDRLTSKKKKKKKNGGGDKKGKKRMMMTTTTTTAATLATTTTAATLATTTTATTPASNEQTTHWDWDESTPPPDVPMNGITPSQQPD